MPAALLVLAAHALHVSSPPPNLAGADASALFTEAAAIASAATPSDAELLRVPSLLQQVFRLDEERLISTEEIDGMRRVVNVTCMQPALDYDGERGHSLFNDELLALPRRPGRRCTDGACTGACSRVFRREFADALECELLIQHVSALMPTDDDKLKHDVSLEDAAAACADGAEGAATALLRMLRLVERMRRFLAREYGVPLRTLRPRLAFANRIHAPRVIEELDVGDLHADECSDPTYHYSGVLYLNAPPALVKGGGSDSAAGRDAVPSGDYTGGDLCFVDEGGNRLLRPEVGMIAAFSSGWENLHHVTPVFEGTRFACPMFFTTQPPPDVEEGDAPSNGFGGDRAARDRALCRGLGLVRGATEEERAAVLTHWASFFE